MLRQMLRSKIHRATLTGKHLEYEGSIGIDAALLKAADILPGEKVEVVVLENGARFQTYAIAGKPGEVSLNGAAARLAEVGDRVIVMAFGLVESREAAGVEPRIVRVDARNAVKKG
ncbi:MAG: aspartate 1-decarboxylase [Planctomycetota bacterium]